MKKPSIWWDFDPAIDRKQYVQQVLEAYTRTPTCLGQVRREDRRLAHRLYDRRIPILLLRAAFYLAAARRLYRPFDADPLPLVRSLHYFLPILDEIREQALEPRYVAYLEWKVRNADQNLERLRKRLEAPSAHS